MKTSKLIRITGDTEADVDAAIDLLCTSGLPIGVDMQHELVAEMADYFVTETWIEVDDEDDLTIEDYTTEMAMAIVERLTI